MTFSLAKRIQAILVLSLALMPLYSLAQQTTSSIEQQASDFIYQQYKEKLPTARIDIKIAPIKRNITISNCKSGYGFYPITRLANRPIVKSYCNDNSNRTFFIRAQVTAKKPAFTALRNIKRGEKITSSKLKLVDVDALRYTKSADELTELSGFIASRSITAGKVITPKLIESAPEVAAGDAVIIEASRSGLTIRTAGTAQETGYSGKFVKVLNNKSGKVINAEVITKGLVRAP